MKVHCVLATSLVLTAGSPMALGDMIYTAQERWVEARADGDGLPAEERRTALDFGPFVAQVEALSSNGPVLPPNLGRASHNSTLEPHQITMSGSIFCRTHHTLIGHGTGGSFLSTTFMIDSPETYTMRVSPTGFVNSKATLWSYRLTGPSGTVFANGGRHNPSFYETSGTLPPGTYTLRTYWGTGLDPWGGAGSVTTFGTYDVRFMIPAPASTVVFGFAGAAAHRRRRGSMV